jgi:hypothetical protein
MTISYEWRGQFTSAEANSLHAECFEHRVLSDGDVERIMRHPATMIASDGVVMRDRSAAAFDRVADDVQTGTGSDGASGELAMPGSALGPNATLEGWFRWRSGTTVLRDSTATGGTGWLLAFATAGLIAVAAARAASHDSRSRPAFSRGWHDAYK